MVNERSEPRPAAPVRPGRYARLRLSIGRHPADLVRLLVAAAVVLACVVFSRTPGINPVELSIFTEVQRLPDWLAGTWRVVAMAGSWPGIVITTGIALYGGRIRMALSLTSASVLAWVLALVLAWLTGPRPLTPGELATMTHAPPGGSFAFPAPETAVAAALVTVATPYLRRPVARLGWLGVVLVAVAQDVLGHHLPVGVFGGAVLGWGCGTLVHLMLGAPGRRTTWQGVRVALARGGIRVSTIAPLPATWWHPLEYDVVTEDGEQLRVKVVRRLHRVAGPTYRLRRALASLEADYEPSLSTPRHEVEHEAYVNLLAQRAGIGTVPVLLAGELDHGLPFLVTRRVPGRLLSTFAPGEVEDELLQELWANVGTLTARQIAHHDLRADTILVDADGRPRITDFAFSRVGGPSAGRPQDLADTLVLIASVVGVGRAVESADRCLERAQLERMLPCLQPLALRRKTRRQLREEGVLLADLRESLAERIDAEVPGFRWPVRPTTLLMLIAGGLAVYLLLPQVASVPRVLELVRQAQWPWLVVATATGLASILAASLSVVGSSPTPLPFWRTTAVQLAAAFTGRTTAAGVGFYAINLSYLERLGQPRARAVAVLVLNRAVHGVVIAVFTGLGVLVIGAAVPIGSPDLPNPWIMVGIGVALVALAAGVASRWGWRRLLRRAVHGARALARELTPALRHPVRATELFGGSAAFLVLQALGLVTTLRAFTTDFSVLAVLAVYIVGATLGQAAPTPGGLGAVEAAVVGGLTAVGVPSGEAVAAVLTSRLLTFWLPIFPGLVAFRVLQHHRLI